MSDVQIAVGLRREARGDTAGMFTGRVVGQDDLANEVRSAQGFSRHRCLGEPPLYPSVSSASERLSTGGFTRAGAQPYLCIIFVVRALHVFATPAVCRRLSV